MKKITLTIITLLSVFIGSAQDNLDKVVLKNGTILQGTISEIIPDSLVTIKLADGRIKTLSYIEIDNIKNNGKRIISPKDKNFYIKGSLGMLLGNTGNYLQKSFLFEASGGYQFKNWNFGAGTGINVLYDIIYLPAMGEIQYTFNKDKTSPFLNVQGGSVFNLSYSEDNYNIYYGNNNYKNGRFIGGNVGLKHFVSDNLALVFEAGYRYYKLDKKGENSFYNQDLWNSLIYYPVQYNANIHRFNLKVGLVF